MKDALKRICELQPHYAPENTLEMQEATLTSTTPTSRRFSDRPQTVCVSFTKLNRQDAT
jgi:hypothetical protein